MPTQTPEGHACHQGTQSGNPKHLDLEPGPFQAGGQAPPIHRVTKSQQGEFNGIPGLVFNRPRLASKWRSPGTMVCLNVTGGTPNLF